MDSKSNLDSPQTPFLMPIWLPVNSSDVSSKSRGKVEQVEAAGLERAIGSYSVNIQWNVSRREMTYLDRITFNPEQCGGRPCIRGMRIRVKDVLDLLAAGVSEKEILEDYPDLEAEDIKACLQYAAAQADHAVLRVP
jgi:uncharacterized protein (DUF433 family)